MKLYYTYDQLVKDLPTLKDCEINVVSGFERTLLYLKTRAYQSLKSQLKRRNIKIKVYRKEDNNE